MSDDEELVLPNKRIRNIHYGSLEEQEKARLAALAAAASEGTVDSGRELSEVHISNEYMDLEDDISKDKKALLEEFERRRKARQLNVSTDDDEVRRSLRQLGEPVCLFGEGPAERRVRLRDLLSYLGEDAIHKKLVEEEARIERDRGKEGTWYYEGPKELRDIRLWTAQYSLPRAKRRLAEAREYWKIAGSVRAAAKQESHRKATSMAIMCSQIGDTRPISSCRFSNDSAMVITASWSGLIKVWSVPDCVELQILRGHRTNVSSAVFHPNATIPRMYVEKANPDAMNADGVDGDDLGSLKMASSDFDGNIFLWNYKSAQPIGNLEGHSPHRVARIAFHPSGRLLGATVYDHSWRLWDLEKNVEVLHQEGHAEACYGIAFQVDGSLVTTGGLDAFGRIWDLRTGRCVMFLEGHREGITSVDWSPLGHQVATASSDNTVKIWEMRTRNLLYTLPAHTHLVSDVRYQKEKGHFLVTSSYDNTAKLWSNLAWHPLNTLSGHDNKVMSTDVSPNNKYIVTSSYDRTFKLWTPEL